MCTQLSNLFQSVRRLGGMKVRRDFDATGDSAISYDKSVFGKLPPRAHSAIGEVIVLCISCQPHAYLSCRIIAI